MKAIELLKSQEPLLLDSATQGKKTKALATNLNQLMLEMNNHIDSFQTFYESQLNGELSNKIIIAKSLAEYFAGNKLLKVELAVENMRNQEKSKMAEYYAVKNKLLEVIKTLLKEVAKEAVVSNYDIFEGNFVKCEPGHEIIILGDRNLDVLETLLKELDEALTIEGCFDNITAQPVDLNLSTLNRNIELCNRKANEIYGAKAGKLSKVGAFITKFEEIGQQVVAFYSYKDALLGIGCTEKGVRDYEQLLSKAYVPLKKTLSKDLRTELEDICAVPVNEAEYPSYSVEEPVPATPAFDNMFEQATSVDNSLFTEPANDTSINNLFAESTDNGPVPSIDNSLFTEPVDNTANTPVNPFDNMESNTTNNDFPTSPFANTPFGGNDDNNNGF